MLVRLAVFSYSHSCFVSDCSITKRDRPISPKLQHQPPTESQTSSAAPNRRRRTWVDAKPPRSQVPAISEKTAVPHTASSIISPEHHHKMSLSDMSHYTSVFRANPADDHKNKVTKRNRHPVSCVACRSRKLKCDRKQPCGTCIKRGDGDSCRFTPAGGNGSSPSGSGQLPRQEVQLRLQRLEEMVQGLITSEGGSEPSTFGVTNSTEADEQIAAYVQVTPESSVLSSSVPRNRDAQETAYHGATYWAAFLEHIHDIKTCLEEAERESHIPPSAVSNPSSTNGSPDLVFGGVEALTIQDVLASLPSKHDMDVMVATYFNAKFSAIPFLHVHQFRRQYEAFYENPQETSFLWISILFSVLCSASVIVSAKRSVATMGLAFEVPSFYMARSVQCLIAGDYLKAKPFAIEAALLYAHSKNIMQNDSDPTIWSLFGLVTRLAQRRGYHRDPDHLLKQLTPFEGEMRRRTWYFIETFDLLFSFQLGMPAIVHEGECDTRGPSNIPDDDFDEDILRLPPSRPSNDPSPMLYYGSKSRLCRILRKVIRHALATTQPPYSQTCALNDALNTWYYELPPCMRIRPIRLTSFTDPNYTIMHRLMLELVCCVR
jgi:hypothetical protein